MSKIPEKMIEAFLTFWYPGEWPNDLGLTGGPDAAEAFKVKSREDCREGFEAAGIVELIDALKDAEHGLVTMQGLRATDLTEEQISQKMRFSDTITRDDLEWTIDDSKTLARISAALAKVGAAS